MNEFTKYELKSILWAIEYVRERTNNCGDIMRKLEGDIKYMTDNFDVKVIKVWHCEKCGHVQ
jgi:hypothetical protein